MIRKILCFLGFHEWEERIGCCSLLGCAWYKDSGSIICKTCSYCKFCKYCNKPKMKEKALKGIEIQEMGNNNVIIITRDKQDD